MEFRRFLLAAVPSLVSVLGCSVAVSFSVTLSIVGSILCVVAAIGLTTLGVSRMKVRTKRKGVSFPVIVNGVTYKVKIFVIIKGTAVIREHFTTPDYWLSVVRISLDPPATDSLVRMAVIDSVRAATSGYNSSMMLKFTNLSTEVDSVTPVKA